jgi:hypothetical protein
MLGGCCLNSMLGGWWTNTNSAFYYVSLLIVLLSSIGYFYWTVAFYLSVRANVPKFVSTKHITGLFGFTLIFFEALVLSLLLWIMYIILSVTGTSMCSQYNYGCHGLLRGIFLYLNTLLVLLGIVLWSVRRQLGIELWDAFGME